ncbi:MAG: DUF4166 domain-containing protein [Paracoccaceae bacterium]|nr:DUF4166 domain-containing protein [Paracoccaceae bacterium]
MTSLTPALYPSLLGDAYANLPAPVQALHGTQSRRVWSGTANVTRGKNTIARLIARLFGFPPDAASVPLRITFDADGDTERWTRDFAGHVLRSVQSSGIGRNEGLLIERFGPLNVALALAVEGDRLCLTPRRWSFLGVPLPKAFLPTGESFETAQNGRFQFDVAITAPVIGLIVAYRGELEECDDDD